MSEGFIYLPKAIDIQPDGAQPRLPGADIGHQHRRCLQTGRPAEEAGDRIKRRVRERRSCRSAGEVTSSDEGWPGESGSLHCFLLPT
jgi:hypothetical protein